ncbi:MAG: hypothetical protein Q6K90_00700 [Gloeomargarita sp. HHBFW_bins_162]
MRMTVMSDPSPIPLYPGSDLLGEHPAEQGVDHVYGTADLLPKVMNFYSKYLGQPQELDARGLNLAEYTIIPQLTQVSWVITRAQGQGIVYHRLGLTPVLPQKQVWVMGANHNQIPVPMDQANYKTLICIGRKQLPQRTSLAP